jgi:hypothetical protein
VEDIMKTQDAMLFSALANALSIHASLDMSKDIKTVSTVHADHIGYQFGENILTYSTLIAYSIYFCTLTEN